MPLVTKAEFARQAGVSRPAIAYALKHGKLIQTDGKIDTTIDENRYYLHRNQGTRTPKNSTPFGKRKDQQRPTMDEQRKALDIIAKKDRVLKQRGELLPKKMVIRVLGRVIEYFHRCAERYDDAVVIEIAQGAARLMKDELDEIKQYKQ